MSVFLFVGLLVTPCDRAISIDLGEIAPCHGILISTDQAKKAVANREELKIRKAFTCPECPQCAPCPKPPPNRSHHWAITGFVAGALTALAVSLSVFIR